MKTKTIFTFLFGFCLGSLIFCAVLLIILLSFTRQSYTIEMCKDLLTSNISFSNYTAQFVEVSTCGSIQEELIQSYERGKCINDEG